MKSVFPASYVKKVYRGASDVIRLDSSLADVPDGAVLSSTSVSRGMSMLKTTTLFWPEANCSSASRAVPSSGRATLLAPLLWPWRAVVPRLTVASCSRSTTRSCSSRVRGASRAV